MMDVYVGASPDKRTYNVVDCGAGAGIIPCYECGGDGDWSKFHPEPDKIDKRYMQCVVCKGTGVVYTSI